ncbi:flavin-containing monooxygenase [Pseudonocardia pini]|uniref:flavin-containing monooxygenase n=1 Tax=Pseudonocardia pini TaxID=2758030 RepID=UPI0015F0604B|nr:NAD(P)/FAD-dependent oxidoreductase [Pseudonocardia pini]
MTDIAEPVRTSSQPEQLFRDWVDEFARALDSRDVDAVVRLFVDDGWWRDVVVLGWDLRTFHGAAALRGVLEERLALAGLTRFRLREGAEPTLVEASADTRWIQGFVEFDTGAGRGKGVVRLVPGIDGVWRAWTVMTALYELRGHELALADRRPVQDRESGLTWAQRRQAAAAFEDEPAVVVVGAGQSGLGIAAHLGLMGVRTLVLEKNPRVGDNWRNRYESLVLHDPVWADHFPFLPFPESWPVYTPKDKLADWMEGYAQTMELDVWTGAELLDSTYDDDTGRWTVRVRRPGGTERELHPAHVVLATGTLTEPNVPELPGAERYRGTLRHSSRHPGSDGWAGRKVVVVGACNSGQDIAKDLYEHDAEVTIVQRSPIYLMSQERGIPTLFAGLYEEGGPPTEDADLINLSLPIPLALQFGGETARAIGDLDRELLDGLTARGFQLDDGVSTGGLMGRALRRGGGLVIDVGCSQLIVDGKIGLASGGVRELVETGVVLDDGTLLEADLVVLATGFANMRETARRLFGDAVADRCSPVWGLDDEGELNAIWRPSGHPGFWFTGGNLLLARIYSRYLAVQIAAALEGRGAGGGAR